MRSGGEEREEIVRERIELREYEAIAAHREVVGEHRGNRDRETERRHDERFTDQTCDLVERALAAHADRTQRVVDAPDRAEESEERRGAADRRENRQPGL